MAGEPEGIYCLKTHCQPKLFSFSERSRAPCQSIQRTRRCSGDSVEHKLSIAKRLQTAKRISAFRAATGRSVHQHLTALRLHAALDRIPERRGDLSGLALELGFSHHAHFTAAFRQTFGISPSAWDRRLAGFR